MAILGVAGNNPNGNVVILSADDADDATTAQMLEQAKLAFIDTAKYIIVANVDIYTNTLDLKYLEGKVLFLHGEDMSMDQVDTLQGLVSDAVGDTDVGVIITNFEINTRVVECR